MDMDLAQTLLRADILRRFGVRCEVLRGGDAIQRRFPHLVNYDEKWTAVYEPDAGTLLAENCLKAVHVRIACANPIFKTLFSDNSWPKVDGL